MEKYWVESKNKNDEKIVLDYLLKNSNVVRFTNRPWSVLNYFIILKKYGDKNDKKFLETLDKLKSDYIKKEVGDRKTLNYYFKLSKNIRNLFKNEELFHQITPEFSKNFYGLEDPNFYNKDNLIGGIISHENYAHLNLNEKDKKNLTNKGLILIKS